MDLAPLAGLPLRELDIPDERISDLGPLRGMHLPDIANSGSGHPGSESTGGHAVGDVHSFLAMSPISVRSMGCHCARSALSIFPASAIFSAVLRGMRLESLKVNGTQFSDLHSRGNAAALKARPWGHSSGISTDCSACLGLIGSIWIPAISPTSPVLTECKQVKYLRIPPNLADLRGVAENPVAGTGER